MTSQIRTKNNKDLKRERRYRRHGCWDHLIAAPLWPLHGVNLGTLLRTCEATGACLAVPRLPWVPEAIERSYTYKHPACVHWTGDQLTWLDRQSQAPDTTVLAVELAEGAIRLGDLPAAKQRTVMVLGHEQTGIPDEALEFIEDCVEIPMIGTGFSLNVAVAGSLVLYKLAGLL
jgi:tRNA (guanosine-2'-O-)-methyltransferase